MPSVTSRLHKITMSKARSLGFDWGNPYTFNSDTSTDVLLLWRHDYAWTSLFRVHCGPGRCHNDAREALATAACGQEMAVGSCQAGAQGEAQGEVQGCPRGHPPVWIRGRSHDASATFRLSCVVRRLGILLPKKSRGARHRVTVVRHDGRLRQRVPTRLERSSGKTLRQVEASGAAPVLP
jgi:hypothetical protein